MRAAPHRAVHLRDQMVRDQMDGIREAVRPPAAELGVRAAAVKRRRAVLCRAPKDGVLAVVLGRPTQRRREAQRPVAGRIIRAHRPRLAQAVEAAPAAVAEAVHAAVEAERVPPTVAAAVEVLLRAAKN